MGLEASAAVIASVVQLAGSIVGLTLSFLLLGERFNLVQVAGAVGLLATLTYLSPSRR